ncbi:MAG TPA: zinc-binding alcohol dehydrogenase, partial [Anaerolineales bacterium]|nr:zinc-binding alcohol dehydrogenase [Anaerolineales bacterium]
MKRKTLYFTAPRQVELREETLPALEADDVLVETTCSAISAGTEMLVYQGRFPRDLETDPVISALRGGFQYPLPFGYACVGRVRKTGTQVDKSWQDKPVFAFQPHTSHFITQPNSLLPIPNSLSPETACFLPNMETAVNLVQDAAPLLGERVLVLGQGVVGLLTAALLSEFPLETLVSADRYEPRRSSSPVAPGSALDPGSASFHKEAMSLLHGHADLTFELSGRPETLNDALALTGFSGRIVIGSWYGEKRAEIDLGGAFHRSRIKLISSQVSTLAPELSGRWDKARRFEAAWRALERVKPVKWITQRFSIEA